MIDLALSLGSGFSVSSASQPVSIYLIVSVLCFDY